MNQVNYNLHPLIRKSQEQRQKAVDALNAKVGYQVFRISNKQ